MKQCGYNKFVHLSATRQVRGINKMKKTKFTPSSEQHHNYLIYDLATTLPDYLLAFHINKNMNMQFIREDDFEVQNPLTGSPENYSLYMYEEHETQKYYLVHNLNDENPLMLNYFIFIEGSFHKDMEDDFVYQLRSISDVLNVNVISLLGSDSAKAVSKKTINMINTLLTDLEDHLNNLSRQKTEPKIILSSAKKTEIKKLYDK